MTDARGQEQHGNAKSRALSSVICRLPPVLVFLFAHRNCVGARDPAVQVDVRAAPAAERAECVGGRPATGRAQFNTRGERAHGIRHRTHIGRRTRVAQAAVNQPNRIG